MNPLLNYLIVQQRHSELTSQRRVSPAQNRRTSRRVGVITRHIGRLIATRRPKAPQWPQLHGTHDRDPRRSA
jgi:hypothetical protein